jgi:hypothetical protein
MLVTLLPIVTLVRPVQRENASPPMLVTLSGIVTLVLKQAHYDGFYAKTRLHTHCGSRLLHIVV